MFEQILFVFRRVRKIAKSDCSSSYVSALSSVGVKQWIFMNFDIWVFFEDVSRKWKFH